MKNVGWAVGLLWIAAMVGCGDDTGVGGSGNGSSTGGESASGGSGEGGEPGAGGGMTGECPIMPESGTYSLTTTEACETAPDMIVTATGCQISVQQDGNDLGSCTLSVIGICSLLGGDVNMGWDKLPPTASYSAPTPGGGTQACTFTMTKQ
jgi:hypothetical protein